MLHNSEFCKPLQCESELWRVAVLAGDPGGGAKLGLVVIPVVSNLCYVVLVVNFGWKLIAPLRWLVSSLVLTTWMAPVAENLACIPCVWWLIGLVLQYIGLYPSGFHVKQGRSKFHHGHR